MKRFLIRFLNTKYSRVLLGFLLFYILVLFQTSFLIHFNIFLEGGFLGWTPNLILITIILINLFEHPEKSFGIFSGFIGGFFLDIFSENFIGFHILILVGLAMVIKFILRNYVRLPAIKRT